MSRSVGIIVKATRLCNLRCSYCKDRRTGPNQTMSFHVMARMIAAALQDTEHDSVEFIWHGGEATVLPMSFYEKALYVESCFRLSRQLVINSFQTNGTYIDRKWAQFLNSNQFNVSISLDGPPEVHDRYRRDASGRGSFRDVKRAMEIFREYGVPFGVLMVINEGTLDTGPDRIFDFLKEQGITDLGLIAVKPVNRPDAPADTHTAHYVCPSKMTSFLARLYDRWEEERDSGINIRELSAIVKRLRGNRAEVCTLSGNCFGNYYLVEPNGDVAHCDVFLGDTRYTLGNIMEQDFSIFRQNPKLTTLREENNRELAAMRECPEFDVCNGWCPHERYISFRHNRGHKPTCCGLSDLIRHIRTRLNRAGSHDASYS